LPTEQYVTPEKKRIVEDNLKQHNRVDPPHDADAQSTSKLERKKKHPCHAKLPWVGKRIINLSVYHYEVI
jgi:hypothetical protein